MRTMGSCTSFPVQVSCKARERSRTMHMGVFFFVGILLDFALIGLAGMRTLHLCAPLWDGNGLFPSNPRGIPHLHQGGRRHCIFKYDLLDIVKTYIDLLGSGHDISR